MIQVAIIAGIILAIFGGGVAMGKKWSDSTWQPTYYTLAKQLTKLQTDLNLKTEIAKGETNVVGAELTVIAKVSEVQSDSMQKEVDRRVDDYLNKLAIAGLQPVPKEGENSSENGYTSSMPLASVIPHNENANPGVFANISKFERGIIQRLIRTRDHAITRNMQCKTYLEELEAEMAPLRAKYKELTE